MNDKMKGVLSGEIHVHSSQDRIYEVFYEKPFIRPPNLRIWQQSVTTKCEIVEQRSDGFKIKGYDLYNLVKWEARGEFVDSGKTHESPTFSDTVFGSPNKKYTYELFVLMPFLPSLKPIYDDHLKKVAKQLRMSIARADDFFSQNSIMHEVWSAINYTSIIIADCTGKNPNVFYEIGIAHALRKPVILITQNQDDVPFDLRHIRYIQYDYTPAGMIRFENDLKTNISKIRKDLANNSII